MPIITTSNNLGASSDQENVNQFFELLMRTYLRINKQKVKDDTSIKSDNVADIKENSLN